jgi:hypothetical protein
MVKAVMVQTQKAQNLFVRSLTGDSQTFDPQAGVRSALELRPDQYVGAPA